MLLQEANDLRDSIDKPQLTARHHLSAWVLSMLGPGTTLAAIVGYVNFLIHIKDKDTRGGNLGISYARKLRGLFDNWRNLGDYLEQNKGFAQNLAWTVGSFVASTVASFPFFLRWQRQRRAEESAVKLSHVERVLEERGFERSVRVYSNYVPRADMTDTLAKPNKEHDIYEETYRNAAIGDKPESRPPLYVWPEQRANFVQQLLAEPKADISTIKQV